MLLDEAEEKLVLKEYSKTWTTLKLGFTAKYFSERKATEIGIALISTALQTDTRPLFRSGHASSVEPHHVCICKMWLLLLPGNADEDEVEVDGVRVQASSKPQLPVDSNRYYLIPGETY